MRLLIAEDRQSSGSILRELLGAGRLRGLREARDGLEASSWARKEQPDLAIL